MNFAGLAAVKRTQIFTIDGKTYDSLEAMPPDVRGKWDALSRLVKTLTAEGAGGQLKPTTLKAVQTVVYGPGETAADSQTGSGTTADPLSDLSAQAASELSARSMLGETASRAANVSTRILRAFIVLLLLPSLFLAAWGALTSVRITMAYRPEWWIAAAALWGVLTGGLAWGATRAARAAGSPKRSAFGQLLALAVGMAAVSALAVCGGVPVLLHQLTAKPGELLVSVTKKETMGGRYSCRPRVIIAEFTFPLRNHLCVGRRAFDEIQVGSRIRLEGEVSDFGVRPDVFTWSKPR